MTGCVGWPGTSRRALPRPHLSRLWRQRLVRDLGEEPRRRTVDRPSWGVVEGSGRGKNRPPAGPKGGGGRPADGHGSTIRSTAGTLKRPRVLLGGRPTGGFYVAPSGKSLGLFSPSDDFLCEAGLTLAR